MEIWFSQMDTENVKTSVRVGNQPCYKQSAHKRLDVVEGR